MTGASKKLTVLNVDDDEPGRYAVSRLLRRAGFDVREAATGREALRLAAEPTDLVVLDVNLPDISGLEVCRRLKSDPATASVPVLHLSATFVESRDRIEGFDAGADGYLTGSVEPSELLATVRALLRVRQAEQALRARARQQAALADLGQRALAGGDVSDLLDAAGAAVTEALQVEYSGVFQLLPDEDALVLRAGAGWRPGCVGQERVELGVGSRSGYDVFSGDTVVVEDWDTESRFTRPSLFRDHHVVSGATVLINRADRPYGVLGAYAARRRTFMPDDVHFLQALANVVALAIERKRAEEERATLLAREQAARAEAEAAHGRAAFLAEVSAILASSLDYRAMLAALARSAVPRLADWCFVDVVGMDDAPRVLAVAHADPARAPLAGRLRRPCAADPGRPHPIAQALRSTRSQLLGEVTEAWLVTHACDPEHLLALRELGPRSCVIVPLLARGRTLGAISFVFAESGRRYGEVDLVFAEEVARRAAVAVDNARLYREAQDAVLARDEFLARASHELRTPLTSAIAAVRLLPRAIAGALKEAPERLAEVVRRNLDTTLALIDRLLDASRLSAGRESLVVEPVTLAGVVDRTLEVVGPLAGAKDVTLEASVPADLVVPADRLKLEQVLVNLAANAVKFTPAGGRVTLDALREDGTVLLRVRDTGDGIAREHLELIFQPFFQVGRRGDRWQRGTGLGLAIARQIVDLHGGRIWAESEGPGRGSTFHVRLPTARIDTRAA